jgi:hypothetical protein
MINVSGNNVERSLIQKAIRRGDAELTEKAARYLINKGDICWLRKRLYVIAYEDCWTMGPEISCYNKETSVIGQYKRLASAVKNKNAAGLAALSMAYINGDRKIIQNNPAEDMIKSVANAVKNPSLFWTWIKKEPGYEKNKAAVDASERAITKAAFPGDKAMMLAAAYLSVKGPTEKTRFADPENSPETPFWIAFDKHTDVGKEIIQAASDEIGLTPSKGMWLAFYFEGSLCSKATDAPFWTEWVHREIRRIGFTMDEARSKWGELKPIIIRKSQGKVSELKGRINTLPSPADSKAAEQYSLF